MSKSRVTITVEPAFLDAAREAISAGRADSLSGWIHGALVRHMEEERRRAAAARAIEEYEAERGVITDEQMDARLRADLRAARKRRGAGKRRR